MKPRFGRLLRGVAVLLVGALVYQGAWRGVSAQTAWDPYDGETVFKGLIFGQGPVAQLLPELWQDPRAQRYLEVASMPAVAAFHANIMQQIRNRDGSFFQRFGVAMQSGDHLQVESAVTEAGGLVREVAEAVMANRPDNALQSMSQTCLEDTWITTDVILWEEAVIFSFVDIAFLLYIYMVVALISVIALVVLLPAFAEGSPVQTSLERDTLVDSIATRLHPN